MKENQLLTGSQGCQRPVHGLGGGLQPPAAENAAHRPAVGLAQRHEAGQWRTDGLGRQPTFPAAAGNLWLALGNREPVPMPERPEVPFGGDALEPLFPDQEGDGTGSDRLLRGAQGGGVETPGQASEKQKHGRPEQSQFRYGLDYLTDSLLQGVHKTQARLMLWVLFLCLPDMILVDAKNPNNVALRV